MTWSHDIFLCHADLDIGESWPESEDESDLAEYASEEIPAIAVANRLPERKLSQTVRIVPDQRKSSTGSQVRLIYIIKNYRGGNLLYPMFALQVSTDSLDAAETFEPVDIDIDSLKNVLTRYEKHRKISVSRLNQN